MKLLDDHTTSSKYRIEECVLRRKFALKILIFLYVRNNTMNIQTYDNN